MGLAISLWEDFYARCVILARYGAFWHLMRSIMDRQKQRRLVVWDAPRLISMPMGRRAFPMMQETGRNR